VDEHFNPPYDPWDQRLCAAPDGDFFRAIRSGRASVVTDRIASFTEKGLLLESGREVEADVIVTATGLNLQAFGGVELTVDGAPVRLADTVAYKGVMLSGVPNLAFAIGYTNASWTLKCDLTCEYVCRLLNHMDERGFSPATPLNRDPSVTEEPFIDFSSGYVLRALDRMPRQGDRAPWLLKQNYVTDLRTIRRGDIDDGVLAFG
jgi:cation diffusion facilitator CzcD-associated flavoprotein CzcO